MCSGVRPQAPPPLPLIFPFSPFPMLHLDPPSSRFSKNQVSSFLPNAIPFTCNNPGLLLGLSLIIHTHNSDNFPNHLYWSTYRCNFTFICVIIWLTAPELDQRVSQTRAYISKGKHHLPTIIFPKPSRDPGSMNTLSIVLGRVHAPTQSRDLKRCACCTNYSCHSCVCSKELRKILMSLAKKELAFFSSSWDMDQL